jgi:hypothetical protein
MALTRANTNECSSLPPYFSLESFSDLYFNQGFHMPSGFLGLLFDPEDGDSIVTCIAITSQRLGKHVSAVNTTQQ